MPRVDRVVFRGTFAQRDEAAQHLPTTGDAALVVRGVPRLLLLRCPCGCGDLLVLNLDRRAGSAWRYYLRKERVTLFPSYWRESACGSHFILWNNSILWCDWRDYNSIWERASDLEERVRTILPEQYVRYEDLADQLQEIPWDVLQACYGLVRKKVAVANPDHRTGQFKRAH